MDTLPQISEEDADQETSMLYEEIKLETESSVVNYIWRHLATIDGAAHWAWEFVKLNDDRELSSDISILADNSAQHIIKTESIHHKILLNGSTKEIVKNYNKNNIENLIRVMMLINILKKIDPEPINCEPVRQGTKANKAKNTHIPQVPRYDSLDATKKEIVDNLSVAGPSGENGIIPTLWIHLSTQSGLLEDIKNPIASILSSTVLKKEYEFIRALVVEKIKDKEIRIPTIPPRFDVHKAYDGLSKFSQTIAELSLAGRVISHLSRKD